jgi:MoaA/NifB/PqqE/SkfB family radical SAM enzyme
MFRLDLAKLFRPPPMWDWLQVEITSHCNGACIYCPRTVYADQWRSRHLPLDTYRKLAPAFAKTRHVHLQGWGEPFLHPHFFEMLALAKKAGCRVGTTTNGTLLDEVMIAKLMASDIDILAFSLAGAAEDNDRIREGTRITEITAAMQRLRDEKRARRTDAPAVHVAHMLFKSGIAALRDLPARLENCGVSDVVVSFLDCVPCAELEQEVIAPSSKDECDELRSLLDDVKKAVTRHGMAIHHPLETRTEPQEGCSENVLRAAFVGSDGAVSPCVLTNMPLRPEAAAVAGHRLYERMVFGNIAERSLDDIWADEAYTAFRRSFRDDTLRFSCVHCPKLTRLKP